jgi:hypothetical protein
MTDARTACQLAIRALEGDESVRVEALLACRMVVEATPALHRVVYSSRSLVSRRGLERLVNHAQASNQVLKVTGVLAHWDDRFVQILEGPSNVVTGLVQTIREDPRHENFMLLCSKPISERRFGQWLMASLELDAEQFGTLTANLEGSTDRMERRIANWMKAR